MTAAWSGRGRSPEADRERRRLAALERVVRDGGGDPAKALEVAKRRGVSAQFEAFLKAVAP